MNAEHSAQALSVFLKRLKAHPVFTNPYFSLLQHGRWNRESYALHRANFFYRTELTVKAIAHVCSRAAAEEDQYTLILFAYILNEECGNGSRAQCHAVLMEDSHNLYGAKEFALEPLSIQEARHHPFILPETELYRQTLQRLIGGEYACMLGVVMALESHAEIMLKVCREAFRNNRHHLPLPEYTQKVESYFNCHVENGVEERHASDAEQCVANRCQTAEAFRHMQYGAEEAMRAQLVLWQALAAKREALGGLA